MKAETKYKGSLKLAAIGDALGWMTEFINSQQELTEKFGVDTIDKFFDWDKFTGGRFNGYLDKIKAGSYSDDTQLLLSVARSVDEAGTVDNTKFAKIELPNWLLYSRGAGRTIKNAARKITRKTVEWNSNFFTFKAGKQTIDYRESGANGAAMRILPIALANLDDSEKINEEIFKNSIITHGHARAIVGAMVYGYAVNLIIRYQLDNFNPNDFIIKIGQHFHEKFALTFKEKSPVKSWIKQWNTDYNKDFLTQYKETLNETQELFRIVYQALSKNYNDTTLLKKIGCLDKQTKGSGISTVLAGIYFSCKYYDKPKDAIIKSVNSLGTDTDSIAAFTGGLIGALHGQSIIPEKWKKVQDYEYLDKIAIQLLEISEEKFNPQKLIETSNYKIISENVKDNLKEKETIFFKPLGIGKIENIKKQKALTKGKYNLIFKIQFEDGQSCIFSKLLNGVITENTELTSKELLILSAEKKLDKELINELRNLLKKVSGINEIKTIEKIINKIPNK